MPRFTISINYLQYYFTNHFSLEKEMQEKVRLEIIVVSRVREDILFKCETKFNLKLYFIIIINRKMKCYINFIPFI